MKKGLWIVGAVLLAVLLAAAYYTYAPRHTPEGQPPLTALDAGNFHELRDLFNASAHAVRVLLLLSPT